MRNLSYLFFTILSMILIIGCNDETYIQGKIIDFKNDPIQDAKVIARKVNPQDHQLQKTASNSDGVFKIDNLDKNSTYEISILLGDHNRSFFERVHTPDKTNLFVFKTPIQIRFIPSKDNQTIIDSKTGLMWARDAARLETMFVDWNESTKILKSIEIGGYKGWRLPTKKELDYFANSTGSKIPGEYFESVGFRYVKSNTFWTSNVAVKDIIWAVDMDNGESVGVRKHETIAIWPVRSSTKK